MTHPALFDPIQLCLDIDPDTQTRTWQQSQAFATPASRWNAYLNQLCLQTLLPWFREDDPHAKPLPNAAALPSFWEWVNGTAISAAHARLVLIPTEAIDVDELRVPQEWIDIPNWAADYYLAVQVNFDEGWVRINGFATHQQVKQRGSYDWRDRTYSLENTDLIADLNALWVSQQLAPDAPKRAEVAAIDPIATVQAENLIQRFANPSLAPQTSLPFPTWAALIQHGGWRQQLTDRRRGLPEQRSVVQWLQSSVSSLAQQFGWEAVDQPSAIGARGDSEPAMLRGLSRRVMIDRQSYELRVLPIGRSEPLWRFELQNLTPGGRIPAGVTLRLLTEDLQPFAGNEDKATAEIDRLYIEVSLEPGEGLVWEIEPTPIDYDREILRF